MEEYKVYQQGNSKRNQGRIITPTYTTIKVLCIATDSNWSRTWTMRRAILMSKRNTPESTLSDLKAPGQTERRPRRLTVSMPNSQAERDKFKKDYNRLKTFFLL